MVMHEYPVSVPPKSTALCCREMSPSAKRQCVFRVTSPSGHTEAELLALSFLDTLLA